MMQRNLPPSQHGAAVIAALLIAALTAALGAAILISQETWMAQAVNQRDRLSAREIAHIGMHWGRAILFDDRLRSSTDHLEEAWAQPMQPIELDGAIINGRIEDAQSRFNLNSLVRGGKINPEASAAYGRLLDLLGLPSDLLPSLVDWEDADDETSGQGGAENYYYLALARPYRAANTALSDIDELRWVRGYNPEIIARLAPYVAALPEYAIINANTASPEVIAAVAGISLAQARQFTATRNGRPVKSSGELAERLATANKSGGATIGFSSNFFFIQGLVRKNQVRFRIEALVGRITPDWPAILWLRQR